MRRQTCCIAKSAGEREASAKGKKAMPTGTVRYAPAKYVMKSKTVWGRGEIVTTSVGLPPTEA